MYVKQYSRIFYDIIIILYTPHPFASHLMVKQGGGIRVERLDEYIGLFLANVTSYILVVKTFASSSNLKWCLN